MVATRPRPAVRRFAPPTTLGQSRLVTIPWSARLEIAAVALLVAYALISRIFIAIQQPPWQGPDEPKHFEYIRTLIDKRDQLWSEHRLPEIDDADPAFEQQVIASMAANHFWRFIGEDQPVPLPATFFDIWQGAGTELHRPSLYYFAGALALAPFVDAPIDQQLLVVRIYSAVLSAFGVLLAYATARTVWRRDPFVPLAAAAFLAALPMNIYVGAIASVDTMAVVVGGIIALGVARGITSGYTRGTLALIFGGLLLGLATKREFVAVMPGIFLALLPWIAHGLRLVRLSRNVRLALLGFIVAAGAAAVAAVTTGAIASLMTSLTNYALNEPNQVDRLLHPPLSTPELIALVDLQRKAFFSSFWAVFGWFNTFLTVDLETILKIICVICAFGVVRALMISRGLVRRQLLWLVSSYGLMIVTMSILALAIPLSYFVPTQLPQGRQIFGTLVPIGFLFAVGTRAWLPASRFGTWAIAAEISILLILLDVTVYNESFAPHFLGRF